MKYLRTVMVHLAAAFVAALSLLAAAEGFPSKPVTVVVGYTAGSATDVVARALQLPMQRALKQTVVVDNAVGAAGSIGVQKVLNAKDDSHTVYVGAANDLILTPLQIPGARYRAESVKLAGVTGMTQFVLVGRPTLEVNDVDALVAYLKNPATPPVSYASSGNGSIFHLTMERFQQSIGSAMVHVPFPGTGPVLTNLIGGQVDLAMVPLVGPVISMINDGRIKAFAVTGAKRNGQIPKVPSVDESRSLKAFYYDMWVGMFVPATTPAPTLERLNAAFNEAQSSPEFGKFSEINAMSAVEHPMNVEQSAKFYADVTEQYRALARAVKLVPQQ